MSLTEAELLAMVSPPFVRPTLRQLERWREAGILQRPRRIGLGRGKGVRILYPSEAATRLRQILALKQGGVRSLADLRWWLWWYGAEDLWPLVQGDLLAAYPRRAQESAIRLLEHDEEALADEMDVAATELTKEWAESRHPSYDRRSVKAPAHRRALAHTAIAAAAPGLEVPVDSPLDDEEGSIGDLVDQAWGENAAETMSKAMAQGGLHFTEWYRALERASASDARELVKRWRSAFTPRQFRREWRFFGIDWPDRAMLMAALLHAQTSLDFAVEQD